MASARCVKCMNPAQNMCNRCQLQTYCSETCFSTHSEAHNRVCGHLIRVRETSIAYLFKRTLALGDANGAGVTRPSELNDTLRLLSQDELFNAVAAYALNRRTPVNDAVLRTVIADVCSSEQYASDAATGPAVSRGVVPITATGFQLQSQQPQKSRQLLVHSPPAAAPPSITMTYSSTPPSPSSPKPKPHGADADIDFGNFANSSKLQMQSLGSSPWKKIMTPRPSPSQQQQQQQQLPLLPPQSAMSPIDACVDAIVERCAAMKGVSKRLADAAATPSRTADVIVADDDISIKVGTDLEVHGESGSSEFLVFRRGRLRIPSASFASGSDGANAVTFISGVVQPANFGLATIATYSTPHFPRISATSPGPDPRFVVEALVDPWEPHDLALVHEKKRWFTNGGMTTPVPEEYARGIAMAARPDFRGAAPEKLFLELCLHFAICQFFLGFRLSVPHRRGLKVRYAAGGSDGQLLVYDAGTGILGSLLSHDGARGPICIRVGDGEPVPVFEELPSKAPSRSGILAAWKNNRTGEYHPGADPAAAARLVVQLLRMKTAPNPNVGSGGSAASAGDSNAAASGETVSPIVDAIPVFRDYVQSKQKPAAIDFLKHLYGFTKDKYPQWFA